MKKHPSDFLTFKEICHLLEYALLVASLSYYGNSIKLVYSHFIIYKQITSLKKG